MPGNFTLGCLLGQYDKAQSFDTSSVSPAQSNSWDMAFASSSVFFQNSNVQKMQETEVRRKLVAGESKPRINANKRGFSWNLKDKGKKIVLTGGGFWVLILL